MQSPAVWAGISGPAAQAADGTGGGGGGTAAKGGLAQLGGQALAHGVHGLQHLVEGDQLADAAQGQFCCNEGVGHTGSVAVLAGVLHQPAYGVAHKAHQIFERHRHGVADLLIRAAAQRHERARRHGRRRADLGLAAARRPADAGIFRHHHTDGRSHQ